MRLGIFKCKSSLFGYFGFSAAKTHRCSFLTFGMVILWRYCTYIVAITCNYYIRFLAETLAFTVTNSRKNLVISQTHREAGRSWTREGPDMWQFAIDGQQKRFGLHKTWSFGFIIFKQQNQHMTSNWYMTPHFSLYIFIEGGGRSGVRSPSLTPPSPSRNPTT